MEPDNPTSPRRFLVRIVLTLVALVMLYFLAGGPLLYLSIKRPEMMEVVTKVYKPMGWFRGTPLFSAYESYMYWWMIHAVPTGPDTNPIVAPDAP